METVEYKGVAYRKAFRFVGEEDKLVMALVNNAGVTNGNIYEVINIEVTGVPVFIDDNGGKNVLDDDEYAVLELLNMYVGHPNSIPYKEELYPTIRETELFKKFHIVFPHEESKQAFNSKDYLKNCILMIAEGSEHATGLGIELGWADMLGVPILCIYKKGKKIAGSYRVITDQFIEYENRQDLIEKLDDYIPYVLSNL
ncbi:hypothetical protein PP175_28855 (plasmid) [Aneurinibacillus sp. Ricciae_BoGa-3]|uniref:hypothetical protein n=1 Tax=Aneurinibacillus sp. Ricciae_BoGa-3 TaxID=3022697 RepID=UPI002341C4F2|nr:hypothetical protein [Aneurinibacillus sp. Ricciae_BoGa-3]WCK57201.1 hypothetical protein PP175_28855 [Aneurinibacillus sp. Ricciae_BoGa-3]